MPKKSLWAAQSKAKRKGIIENAIKEDIKWGLK